jgi:hypothetical protein
LLLTGGMGFLWRAVWWSFYAVSSTESNPAAQDDTPAAGKDSYWVDLLRSRQVRAITVVRFLEEPAFWVYICCNRNL